MELMKELLNSQVNEESPAANHADMVRFKKVWDLIERDLDHLDSILADKSNFSNLVKKMGGDTGWLEAAKKSFKELDNSMMELHKSVGIAQGDSWR